MHRYYLILALSLLLCVFPVSAETQPFIASALATPHGVTLYWDQPIGTDVVAIWRQFPGEYALPLTSYYRAALGGQAYEDSDGYAGVLYRVTVFASGSSKRGEVTVRAQWRQWLPVI